MSNEGPSCILGSRLTPLFFDEFVSRVAAAKNGTGYFSELQTLSTVLTYCCAN